MVEPHFTMHWAEEVIRSQEESGASITVWAGRYRQLEAPSPPPASWASNPENQVHLWLIELPQGSETTIPALPDAEDVTRNLYILEGQEATLVTEEGRVSLQNRQMVELENASHEILLQHPGEEEGSVLVLVLGGRPLHEPVAQYGPFVMNTDEEIQEAFQDYRATQFGGWPWDQDDYVFDREKGRFALINGEELFPPTLT